MLPDDLPALTLYQQLLQKVDQFSARVEAELVDSYSCRAGCDSCCQLETVFPVEAYAVALTLLKLPLATLKTLCHQSGTGGLCCLLAAGCCSIYHQRPLICRSHGLPLMVEQEGVRRIDHCPINFVGLESFPGVLVLQLEAVNQPLVAINQLFLQQAPAGWTLTGERINLAELLQWVIRHLQSGPDVV
jgi:Fe-S-cluster containining protein